YCGDLVADRTRAINRLRGLLSGIFPALERVLELSNKGPLVLLSGYQTPAAIRRSGRGGVEAWLRARKVRSAAALAQAAVEAADRQHTTVAGEQITADIVAALAEEVMALNARIEEIDHRIQTRFADHELAVFISSLPGMGPQVGAEFLAATHGDMGAFGSADRLAGFAGLAPVPRDSGRVSGNLHRPQRYHRRLQRALYLAAFSSLRVSPESRRFYDRKRAEGKTHSQAILALARRRVNVLWALIRDRRRYQPPANASVAA
uniref:IS110 family transposase n=1 Tax=Streptosporangium amethystogenes TaxID=2002 RepID=UPI0004CBFC1F